MGRKIRQIKNGKNAKENKFDGRPMIGLPSYFKGVSYVEKS